MTLRQRREGGSCKLQTRGSLRRSRRRRTAPQAPRPPRPAAPWGPQSPADGGPRTPSPCACSGTTSSRRSSWCRRLATRLRPCGARSTQHGSPDAGLHPYCTAWPARAGLGPGCTAPPTWSSVHTAQLGPRGTSRCRAPFMWYSPAHTAPQSTPHDWSTQCSSTRASPGFYLRTVSAARPFPPSWWPGDQGFRRCPLCPGRLFPVSSPVRDVEAALTSGLEMIIRSHFSWGLRQVHALSIRVSRRQSQILAVQTLAW